MIREKLPTPSDLLEELADKVIEAIDSLKARRFDAALEEMIQYHSFLLDAYSTQTEEGTPFSYAQIDATWFGGLHQQWIREYRRVFERAVSVLGTETEFASTLSGLPLRLLSPRVAKLSSPVIAGILDLSAILVSRLEAWLTRHVSVETIPGQPASPRLSLSGSDKSAFSDVLLEFSGSWESTIQYAGSLYRGKTLRLRYPKISGRGWQIVGLFFGIIFITRRIFWRWLYGMKMKSVQNDFWTVLFAGLRFSNFS